MVQYCLSAAGGAIYNNSIFFHQTDDGDIHQLLRHVGFTCSVEPSHIHHGFVVGQLYVFLGYYQLDLVPLLRLIDNTHSQQL